MAVTYSGRFLSQSTNGRPIKVTGTDIAGANTVHTAPAGTASYDEVTLYVANTSGSDVTLGVLWGGTTDPDDHVCKGVVVPANSGPVQVVPALRIDNGLSVKVYAGTTAVLTVTGVYNRVGA